MGIVSLNTNLASLNAQRRLSQTNAGLGQSYERLASGLRIQRASDDAAGLAVAQSLQTDSRILSQGIRNVNDGISLLNITQGAVEELSKIVLRLQELAEQSANGTLTSVQRRSIDREATALRGEYNRVAVTTTFNGLSLLEAPLQSIDLQVGTTGSDTLRLSVGTAMARNIGDGTFNAGATLFNAAAGIRDVEVGDINNDGNLDIVSSTNVGPKYSMLGNGDGTFRAPLSFASGGGNAQASLLADFNNDGNLDLVNNNTGGGTSGSIYIGNGNGSFIAPVSWNQTTSSSPVVGNLALSSDDFNNDGNLDLVLAAGTDSFQLTFGNGDGTFRAAISMISATGLGVSGTVRSGDINGDGKADLLIGATGPRLAVLQGNGDGTFKVSQQITSNAFWPSASFVDVDNDGNLDIAGISASGTLSSYSYMGNGDGTFRNSALRSTGISAPDSVNSFLKFTDLNGDGFQDMLFTDSGTNIFMMTGNGDGSFLAPTSFSSPAQTNLNVGDFNGDGVVDLATASSSPVSGFILLGNSQKSGTLEYINLKTQSSSLSALTILKTASQRLSSEMGNLGANMSRLSTASTLIFSQKENFERAASQIRDVDVAEESSSLMRRKILQQAAMTVLTEANLLPELAVKLLKV